MYLDIPCAGAMIMTTLSCVVLFQFATMFAVGQVAQQSAPSMARERPETVVRDLYRQVVARRPFGIPKGKDRQRITPYLSKILMRRLDTAQACEDDYYQHYYSKDEKPGTAWFEMGLFSGGNEQAEPGGFRIDSTQPSDDGSFLVYLRLRYKYDDPPPFHWWHIAVVVVREGGHFVVDDVIFPKDVMDVETRLSQVVTVFCDGSRWVGYSDQQNDSPK
jgi:hypothetical protein